MILDEDSENDQLSLTHFELKDIQVTANRLSVCRSTEGLRVPAGEWLSMECPSGQKGVILQQCVVQDGNPVWSDAFSHCCFLANSILISSNIFSFSEPRGDRMGIPVRRAFSNHRK